MPETLEKLRPDRDLQCYFERPSAIAAISGASASGFTVSGTWRQQFDWCVIEWNRDNVFEHPLFRYLPDQDLSGLELTYEETRDTCIPLDSDLFPTVDWPYLRIWAEKNGEEKVFKVPLRDHATAIEGNYTPATAVFELQGTATPGDYIELAWLTEHVSYQMSGGETLESAATELAGWVNTLSTTVAATASGAEITLQYLGSGQAGANGNRVGVYGNTYREGGAASVNWSPGWQTFSGGTSPTKWSISLDFGAIEGFILDPGTLEPVPTGKVRKMRWTYSADMQAGSYERSEFQVAITNWTVAGSNRSYRVAGPGSRRIEDDRPELSYSGTWGLSRQNYSGGSIRYASSQGASVSVTYRHPAQHDLYLGTRKADNGARVSIQVDGGQAISRSLAIPLEDVLVRLPLGTLAGGVDHTVTVTHDGPEETGLYFYFDFFELAIPATTLPAIPADTRVTLATDWDTDHSIALAAERTAWMIHSLGFHGRHNYYAGALWFYEMYRKDHSYASGTVTFSGTPGFGEGLATQIAIGLGATTTLEHLHLIGDTAESIAKAFELRMNNGYTGIRAQADGATLTIYSRAMGATGNVITLSASSTSEDFLVEAGGSTLEGGYDGDPEPEHMKSWRTDLSAAPRINRAARDWSRAFFQALDGYGIDCTTAFSMELQHGDPAAETGIAQRYPSGNPVLLNTPALQTNFGPESTAFWKQVYTDMAALMADAGFTPYLQFGEVQWWYFPYDASGLSFYDAYTTSTFSMTYGHPMHTFVTSQEDPAQYPEESAFLPGLIGTFTSAVMNYVRQTHSTARFEVLYPPDVNDSPLNRVINLPASWNTSTLDNFKTENFTYTGDRNLNKCYESVRLPMELGFPRSKSSHLIGIGDYTTPWRKELRQAKAEGVESVVLFALDQFCLIGYGAPLRRSQRRSRFMG